MVCETGVHIYLHKSSKLSTYQSSRRCKRSQGRSSQESLTEERPTKQTHWNSRRKRERTRFHNCFRNREQADTHTHSDGSMSFQIHHYLDSLDNSKNLESTGYALRPSLSSLGSTDSGSSCSPKPQIR